jgi:SNF family Na+-dependent transporter
MFISFSKTLAKVGGFRIGFRKKITSKNLLWVSLLYLTVVMCQLMFYSAVLVGWLLYAFCYGIVWVTKYLFKDFSERFGKLKATIIIAVIYSAIILILAMVSSASTSAPTADPIATTESIVEMK